ncbi:MAG: tRNA-(ms[2]io[6]A)-hydroxylase [Gammaproteobacteria bacterium]
MSKVTDFLACPTPKAWLKSVHENIDLLLIDHAHCEKKAASMAIKLMFQYPEHVKLMHCMSRLAREELRHFEQVLVVLNTRNVTFKHQKPSRYAGEMHRMARTSKSDRLVDLLIIGAFIEARSCERFSKLVPLLNNDLAQFYGRLHEAEERHFENYLDFAGSIAGSSIESRVNEFAAKEADLIQTPDTIFRFHSGPLQ